MNATLADFILVIHAAFVVFVVAGLGAIWVGIAMRASFARNPWFRGLHLAAIAFVVAESLLGYACPLTVWEDELRGASAAQGFIERWVHAWMFYEAPTWAFTVAYVAFAALVGATWWRFPPRRR